MPNLGIGLFIGDSEGDAQVGPVGPDGVIQSEAGAFLTGRGRTIFSIRLGDKIKWQTRRFQHLVH